MKYKKITEEQPKDGKQKLCVTEYGYVIRANYVDGEWVNYKEEEGGRIVYWCDTPDVPSDYKKVLNN